MNEPVTIVIVRALGLSGATWFNLVLGSHAEAMALGPPSRLLDLAPAAADQACLVHRAGCDFWPAFLRAGDHRGSFFRDLAAATGKRVFVVNYPPKVHIAREIDGQGFRVLTVRLVRDGRACLHSHMRHYGSGAPGSGIVRILNWQIQKWNQVDRKTQQSADLVLVVRYEDMVLEPERELARIGRFIGIVYLPDATEFWRTTRHLTAGNTGVIDLLCRMQDVEGHANQRAEAYEALAAALKENPQHRYLDERWKTGLGRDDLLAFDCLLGARNAAFGYERDVFPAAEVDAFWRSLDERIAQGRALDAAPPLPEPAAAAAAATPQAAGGQPAPLTWREVDDAYLTAFDVRAFNDGRNPFREGDDSIDNAWSRWSKSRMDDLIANRLALTGGRVLDLMCGFGRWVPALAANNTEVLGIDRNAEAVQLARRLCAHFRVDNARFAVGDVALMADLPAASFDSIFIWGGLMLVDRAFVMAQAHRLLVPDGHLYAGACTSTGLVLQHIVDGARRGALREPRTGHWIAALHRGPLAHARVNYLDLDSCAPVCEELGFDLVGAAPAGYLDVRAPDARLPGWESAHWFGPYPRTIEFLARRSRHAPRVGLPSPAAAGARGEVRHLLERARVVAGRLLRRQR